MLIILDRDGVINYDSAEYIKTPEEWIPIPGSLEAIADLSRAGHDVVVASNQSGVGRGYYTLATLEKIHQKMQQAIKANGGHLSGIYFCPHTPADNCECRKPKPGLLLAIAKDYPSAFQHHEAILVGDSLRDIQAAHSVGCKAVLVKTGNGEYTVSHGEGIENVPVYNDLREFADSILM
jgi:D-glycero-D-manno-heptose 1,7-bisphosphate phosphatase